MRDPDLLTSPRRNLLIQVVGVVSLIFAVYYMAWRLTVLNPDAMTFSLILWAAEAYGVVHLSLFLFTVWEPVHRRPRPAPEGLDVDVFITTYNEPLDVLRKTVVAAKHIRYPHRTWVLDDGCRDEVRELTTRLGVGYIPREGNEHAKAGNLNNALFHTRGEFFLQLDADHVPLPHILDRLLGYFDDPRMAFVQSPQDFYNLDSFTHVMDDDGRRVWEEQRIFFDVIQPGKDRWNAAFFCGSCGMFRRTALAEIGGFSTQTVIEDMETSIVLHSRGWKSAYVAESLAYGLSPGSMSAYVVQRLRWASGSMQLFRKFTPLRHKGLTWKQRLCYFDSCVGYLDGPQKLVLLAAPFVYFITGVLPVRALDTEFLVRFFPCVFLQILSFELLSRGRGYLWLTERYSMIRFPIYTRALAGYFARKPIPFRVTPKGSGHTPVAIYKWQLLVLFGTPAVLVWATVAQAQGWIDYGAAGWGSGAFILNGGWMLWNMAFAWQVVRMARRPGHADGYRFKDEMPVTMRHLGRTGADAAPAIALTHELSASQLAFLSALAVEPGERMLVVLPLVTGDRDVTVEVVSRKEVERGGVTLFDHLCRTEGVDLETEAEIELHCLHHAMPGRQKRYRHRADMFESARRFLRERRRERRTVVRLPAQLRPLEGVAAGRWHPAVLEELDDEGAQLILDRPIEIGTPVQFQVPGVDVDGCGSVVNARLVETQLARRWVLGIRRQDAPIPFPRLRPEGDTAERMAIGVGTVDPAVAR